MKIEQFVNEPVHSNCYVLYDKEEGNCIIVDPGSRDNSNLLTFFNEEKLTPIFVVLTHEHFDHIWGVNDLVTLYRVPIICSTLCSQRIKDSYDNCSAIYDETMAVIINSPTICIESLNNELYFGKERLVFISTPGHSDASLCLLVSGCLFTGDALIKNTKTVTKLPTGSKEKQKKTLTTLRMLQGQNLIVYPGHGEPFELDGYDLNIALDV